MQARTHRKSTAVGLLAVMCALSVVAACSAPRRVHDPIQYPELDLACSSAELSVEDPRLSGATSTPGAKQLRWPQSFESQARAHLGQVVAGTGPALRITTRVGAADELELVDARGEVTRVSVTLHFDINVVGGSLVRRAEAHSSYDIPRDEATAEELEVVLDATALDAFDRYWAAPSTITSLNKELEAHARRHSETTPAASPSPSPHVP